ncbi:hypothetical protein ACFL1P_00690 [Patescibacteria group bacterium]
MDSDYMDESVYTPPWKSIPTGSSDDASSIQMNPSSAYATSSSSSNYRQIFTTAGLVGVLIVAVIGGLSSVQQQQSVSVRASVDLKHSIRGTVDEVSVQDNTFVLLYSSSIDPVISEADVYRWKVSLPPGEIFLSTDTGIETCSTVSDITKSLSDSVVQPCSVVVQTGKKLVVEYLILQTENKHMIAKKIIGEN